MGCGLKEKFILLLIQEYNQGPFNPDKTFYLVANKIQEFLQIRVFWEGHTYPKKGFIVPRNSFFMGNIP